MERPVIFSAPMVRAILEDRKTQTRRVVKPVKSAESIIADPNLLQALASEQLESLEIQGFAVCLDDNGDARVFPRCPYGQPGDRLWVRETWGVVSYTFDEAGDRVKWTPDRPAKPIREMRFGKRGYYTGHVIYAADGSFEWTDEDDGELRSAWKPSIHMPRLASRIHLEITDVRVQRVQDISEEDAIAEGCSWVGADKGREFYSAHSFPPGVKAEAFNPSGAPTAKEAFAHLWDSINEKRGYGWNANPWTWALTFKRVTEAK